ncbi:MAG: transposase, partial [Acidimicrobiales bacterium]
MAPRDEPRRPTPADLRRRSGPPNVLRHLGDAHSRAGAEIHAYALMPNHYHLLVRSEVSELSALMRQAGGRYTQWFNKKYGLDGALLRGRFRSKPVCDDRQLREVVRYIHRNPIPMSVAPRRSDFEWTSHPRYVGESPHPAWLSTGSVLERFSDLGNYRRFVEGDQVVVGLRDDPSRTRTPGPVRMCSPLDVEFALGVASASERALLRRGGRGVRNDLRLACVLLCRDTTDWTLPAIAHRYGFGTTSRIRGAVARAVHLEAADSEFAALTTAARQRLAHSPM